jgi:hypothetical protein
LWTVKRWTADELDITTRAVFDEGAPCDGAQFRGREIVTDERR